MLNATLTDTSAINGNDDVLFEIAQFCDIDAAATNKLFHKGIEKTAKTNVERNESTADTLDWRLRVGDRRATFVARIAAANEEDDGSVEEAAPAAPLIFYPATLAIPYRIRLKCARRIHIAVTPVVQRELGPSVHLPGTNNIAYACVDGPLVYGIRPLVSGLKLQ